MTGPAGTPDPTAAAPTPADRPKEDPDRTAPTGWPGRPDERVPDSAARAEVPPGSGWAPSSPGTPPPARPAVPAGVPPRSTPLPPPRTTPVPPAAATGRPGPATVVPEGVRRPVPRPVSRPASAAVRGRKAKLALKRLDPWSVFVTSLLLSLLLALATILAAFLLYAVLSALGVPQSINHNIGDISKTPNILTQGKFVGIAALIAGANVVLLTALATIGAMLYNVVSTFTGGVELTLAERD